MKPCRALLACVLASLSLLSGGAWGQVVTEFSTGITAGAAPDGITAGPDGNLWFAEPNANGVARITPLGVVTEFSAGITAGAQPVDIAAGPDGNLWFTQNNFDRIGRITPLGVVTEFSTGISASAGLFDITAGPDGNLWFTELTGNRIGRITTSGSGGGPAPTTSAVVSSLNPSLVGQSVTFTATVTGNSPTGTVQFKDGAGNLGAPVTLSGGSASFTTASLAVGTHSITAVYGGDINNAASTSPAVVQTVNASVVPPPQSGHPIPTLSALGMILLSMLLGALGISRRGSRRRKPD
jgi:hypothetical protein